MPAKYYIGTLKGSQEGNYHRIVTIDCKIGDYAGETKTINLVDGTLMLNSTVYLVNGYK